MRQPDGKTKIGRTIERSEETKTVHPLIYYVRGIEISATGR